jgi:hypothetical protein
MCNIEWKAYSVNRFIDSAVMYLKVLLINILVTYPEVLLYRLILNEVNTLTHYRRIMRILVFAFQAWKTDDEDPHY